MTRHPSPPTADAPREPTADYPELDGTDGAHPAWWRGNDRGVDAACERIAAILDGSPGPHHFGSAKLTALDARLSALVAERDEAVRECEGWRWAHWGHPEASWACRCGAVNGAGINQCVGYETECGAWRPMKPKILAEVQAGATYDAAMVEKHRAFPAAHPPEGSHGR